MYNLKGRMVKIPTTGRIKIRGDMYGPLNTPHFETLDDIKLMLTYGVEVIGFKAVGGSEEKLTLENYANENVIEIGNSCKHDATTEKLVAVTLPMLGQTQVDAGVIDPDMIKEEEDEEEEETAERDELSQQPKVAQAPQQNQKARNKK